VARAFDLRLNGHEFEAQAISCRAVSLGIGQLTPTGLAGRSGLVRVYLAAGEKPPSVRLSRQLL